MVSSWTFTNNALGVSTQLLNLSKKEKEKHHYVWAGGRMVGEMGTQRGKQAELSLRVEKPG